MGSLIKAMFDFDEDVSVLERDMLEKKNDGVILNYVHLFLQVNPVAKDEVFVRVNRCLNQNHSEQRIDVFR